MAYETDKWLYIPAKWQKAFSGKREVRWIVIHCMQAPKTEGRARACGLYFQDPPRAGSSHVTVDNKEIIQCVLDNNIAAGAIGANTNGIHIEQPGYASETTPEWDDEYGLAGMDLAADVAAQYCLKFDIPPMHLTNEQLAAKQKGIVGHIQVSQVSLPAWGIKGSGHTDPGVNFPWEYFMGRVQFHYDLRKAGQSPVVSSQLQEQPPATDAATDN
jgi:hypothetical protein